MTSVSFVVTVYNKAPYLKDLVQSLRTQTGVFEREFIFIDDGSTDNSLDLLRAETAGLERCVVERRPNGGQARASNAGFALASCEYIKPVDADDILHHACTARLIAALDRRPEAVLAWCGMEFFRDREDRPDSARETQANEPVFVRNPLRVLLRNVMANPTQLLIRTEALRASGGADERIRHSMEYALMLRIALRGPFVRVPETLAFVRTGMTGNLSSNQRLTMQESMRAPALFLRDHPEVAPSLKRLAARRAAGRAWLWRLRKVGAGPFSVYSLRRLVALMPLNDYPAFLERCADSLAE